MIARASALAATALLGLAAAPAAAQDPGTDVGGTVPSYLALSLDEPTGFADFPDGPGDHELAVRARVTASDTPVRLSVVDGDVTAGARLGRLASGSSVLGRPLEARIGAAAFQPLDVALAAPLAVFRRPVANAVATIRLRQRIEPGERPRGTYAKTLLITLTSNAP